MAADSSDSDNPLQSSTTDVDDEEDETYQPTTFSSTYRVG